MACAKQGYVFGDAFSDSPAQCYTPGGAAANPESWKQDTTEEQTHTAHMSAAMTKGT